jgi:putative AbiEi antitoxin of type IV toxin-antitoxin system
VEPLKIQRLGALASGQHQLFTVQQAAALGVSETMLWAAAKRGWIHPFRHGVYVMASAGPSRWRPVVAAALSAGPNAAVSHITAAMAHHMHGVHSDEIELTIAYPSRRNLQGITVHRSSTLLPSDVQERFGVRVTTPIRTLVDLADRFDDPMLGLIVDEGTIGRLWTPESVSSRLEGLGHGVAGVTSLRRLVAERTGEGHPDSRLEQRVIRTIKGHVPGYTLHHRIVIDGQVIDMDIAWVDQKIDGEVDGMRTRALSRTKFEHERRRINALQRHGWRVVHFTDKMDRETLLAQIVPLLAR